jgi:two-component system chemotaxis sensor kinase CheA
VVKPLGRELKGLSVFAGATIMGDGRVALILDALGLAHRAGVVSGARERTLAEKPTASAEILNRQAVLLFAAGGGRMAIPLSQVARLEEFPRSAIERVGGRDVVQYRGEIMPLVHVGRVLRERHNGDAHNGKPRRPRANGSARAAGDETVPVVVCARDGRRVGLVVGRILDVVEETITVRSGAGRPGVMFAAVVQDRVTEFLDIGAVVAKAAPGFIGTATAAAGG